MKVPMASTQARTATQPRTTSPTRWPAPIDRTRTSTSSDAMTPRRKINWALGIDWLAYLTSESLTTKQPMAAHM
jgi:hypothetical protein